MIDAAPPRPRGEPALWQVAPSTRLRPWARLGDWPTPVTAATGELSGRVWFKREDLSSTRYGGNKVRTLELALGAARAADASAIWATGAYGSNHVLATALHAPTIGIPVSALLFPQPVSEPARANVGALAAAGAHVELIGGVLTLPLAMARVARREPDAVVMPPGAATPVGALGALSAGIELALQVMAGELPPVDRVVVPAGSVCTSAGLLAGLHWAAAHGLGPATPPTVVAVRVTPWPVTSALRIVRLARAALALVPSPRRGVAPGALRKRLIVDGSQLGIGYGHPSLAGGAAAARLRAAGSPPLDDVYSAKAGAALLARNAPGVTVLWATKSSAPLAEPTPAQVAALPPMLARWYRR
jgi:1-aminocyclopropane-1-carboxylate deaminase/D-cysteine desulfhydrase-like pyridoxal-dependent ACC family enzyme